MSWILFISTRGCLSPCHRDPRLVLEAVLWNVTISEVLCLPLAWWGHGLGVKLEVSGILTLEPIMGFRKCRYL